MSQNSCIPFIICGLLEHFFSEHRSEYHNGDIDWLLKLSNEKVMWRCSHIRILTDNAQHGIPFGVVKHYLLRVLVHDRNQEGNNITLANFNAEVINIYEIIATSVPMSPHNVTALYSLLCYYL